MAFRYTMSSKNCKVNTYKVLTEYRRPRKIIGALRHLAIYLTSIRSTDDFIENVSRNKWVKLYGITVRISQIWYAVRMGKNYYMDYYLRVAATKNFVGYHLIAPFLHSEWKIP